MTKNLSYGGKDGDQILQRLSSENFDFFFLLILLKTISLKGMENVYRKLECNVNKSKRRISNICVYLAKINNLKND